MECFDVKTDISFIHGRGLFAKEQIRMTEEILVPPYFDSEFITFRTLFIRKMRDRPFWSRIMPFEKNCLFPIHRDESDPVHYINHSFTPNAIWRPGDGVLVAVRNIGIDNEITIDYTTTHSTLYMEDFVDAVTGKLVDIPKVKKSVSLPDKDQPEE